MLAESHTTEDTKPQTCRAPVLRKPWARSRTTNSGKLPGVDGRSAWARRHNDLVALLVAEMGGKVSPIQLLDVHDAAATRVRIEQMTAATLRGEAIDNDQAVREGNRYDRQRRQLGLKAARPAVETSGPSIDWPALLAGTEADDEAA